MCTTNSVGKPMTYSMPHAEPSALSARVRNSPASGAVGLACLPQIGDAASPELALALFRQVVADLGADAGMFMSCLQDDATRTSYRSLLACDPAWGSEYAARGWFKHDPWLRHATEQTEPIRSSELMLITREEEDFAATAATFGFASAVIAPAPSCAGISRVGVLCLGSDRPGFFDDEGHAVLRVLSRALAMELHRWLMSAIKAELLTKSRLTEADLALLRHQDAGHSSKAIGAALNIEAKTVDCRFQRVSAKLEAPDRRTAVRIARLYGLL